MGYLGDCLGHLGILGVGRAWARRKWLGKWALMVRCFLWGSGRVAVFVSRKLAAVSVAEVALALDCLQPDARAGRQGDRVPCKPAMPVRQAVVARVSPRPAIRPHEFDPIASGTTAPAAVSSWGASRGLSPVTDSFSIFIHAA
jgi:hypothetical protein